MTYEIQDRSLQTTQTGTRIGVYTVFGLLLLLSIWDCTIAPSPWIMPLLLGPLAIVAMTFFRPLIALLLVFVSAGLPTLVVSVPGHNVRPVEAALWLCLLLIFIHHSYLRLRLPHLLALLFLAIVFISFLHVPEFSASVDSYTAENRLYGDILMILALFCGSFLARYVKSVSSFLVAVLLGNIPLYLITLAQALGLSVPSFLASISPTQLGGRLPGPFVGSVELGMYLVNLLAISIACWLLGKRRRDRVIGACMVIATGLGLAGSGTISSALAGVAIVVVAFFLAHRFRMLIGVLIMCAIVAALGVYFNKLPLLFAHNDTSTRFFLWQEALSLIVTHPWIGIGLWQFPKYYALLVVSQATALNPHGGVSIHEQFLEWAMEGGIIWLLSSLLLLGSIMFSCWQAFRLAGRGQQPLFLAVILAVLANMIICFFDVPFDKPEGAIFLFLLVGVALGHAESVRWKPLETLTPRASKPGAKTVRLVSGSRGAVALPFVWSSPANLTLPQSLPVTPVIALPASGITSHNSSSAFEQSTHPAADARKTGRSIIIQLLSWALPIPVTISVTALLTRYLGPAQYGEYSFALSFFAVIVLLSGYGIDPFIMRLLSQKPRDEWGEILGHALGTRLVTTLVCTGISCLVTILLPLSPEQRNILLLGSLSLFFSFSMSSFRSTVEIGFRAEQRVGLISWVTALDRLVTAGLVAGVVIFHLSLLWACLLIIYSDTPFFLVEMFVAYKRFALRISFHFVRARKLLLASLPLIGYNVTSLLSAQIDLLLLMALAGVQSVGLYALASKITDPLLSIVLAYAFGLYPLLCAKFVAEREQFAKVCYESTRILALVIVPLAIFVSIKADPIVAFLGGQHFVAAAIAVQLLIWAMAVTFFNQLAVRVSMAAHLERQMLYITLISSIVNIVSNIALIPHWQIMGAGIASLGSELVGLCLLAWSLKRYIHLFSLIRIIFQVVAGNLPMLVFLLWQQNLPLLLTVPLAIGLLSAGYFLTRVLSLKDLHLARTLLQPHVAKKELSDDIANLPTEILVAIDDIEGLPTDKLPQIHI